MTERERAEQWLAAQIRGLPWETWAAGCEASARIAADFAERLALAERRDWERMERDPDREYKRPVPPPVFEPDHDDPLPWAEAIPKETESEREACARICDDMATMVMPSNPSLVTIPTLREHQAMSGVAKHCAMLIRARGKP